MTYEQLEKITRIDNVTIISYQSLAYKMVKREEGNNDFDFSQFKYVVFDECHFILADSEFNNITRYALAKILEHEFYTTKIQENTEVFRLNLGVFVMEYVYTDDTVSLEMGTLHILERNIFLSENMK